ncbi:signal transduction protein [Billgrantia azerbaijanica]|nr:signal transduction protein [Halomonas azerbaijanica]
MRLLHRASPWRDLFADDTLPDPSRLPALLAPLCTALAELGPAPSLAEAHAWQGRLVEALERLDLPAGRICQLISDHNDWLYRRAIALSLDEMIGQGWGPPPVAYCVLTLGSAARHESLLGPDQDNAMIVADYPDARHTEIDGYFQSLGERFTARLDEAGIPLCNGHVMARWPMWRKCLSEWREQLAIWSAERRVKRVQQANILLDFQPVHGDASLAEALRDVVVERLPKAGLFLDEMAALLDELPVALDRFGRLVGGGEGAPHERAVNLKRQGMLPLVGAVRLLALRHGVRPSDTRLRLADLVAKGVLDSRQAHGLAAALERLQARLLAAQRRHLAGGGGADGWVDLSRLEDDERLLLRHDLQVIRRFVRQVGRR